MLSVFMIMSQLRAHRQEYPVNVYNLQKFLEILR